MKQKTVITQLIEFYDENKHLDYFVQAMLLRGKMEELEPVNEQQIKDAYNQDLYGGLSGNKKFNDGEQYFNQTFEK